MHGWGRRRPYTRQTLTDLATICGLEIENPIEFNRTGTIAWFLNGRISDDAFRDWSDLVAESDSIHNASPRSPVADPTAEPDRRDGAGG